MYGDGSNPESKLDGFYRITATGVLRLIIGERRRLYICINRGERCCYCNTRNTDIMSVNQEQD